MTTPLYHCVRGIQLDVPGAIKNIGPLQTAALQDVTYMPWLNMHHCVVDQNVTPLVPDPIKMRAYIEDVVLDDNGYPISDFMYLDIEGVLSPNKPWYPGKGDVFRDCINIAQEVLHWRGSHRCRVFIWDSTKGRFKWDGPGAHPDYRAHAQIDPYCDALYLSMYGSSRPNPHDWRLALKLDMDVAQRYAEFFSPTYCHGRPRVFFVWGWHGRMGFYPEDMWQAWIEFLKTLMWEGDVVCWFGAAHQHNPALDQHYGPQIDLLKTILSTGA